MISGSSNTQKTSVNTVRRLNVCQIQDGGRQPEADMAPRFIYTFKHDSKELQTVIYHCFWIQQHD